MRRSNVVDDLTGRQTSVLVEIPGGTVKRGQRPESATLAALDRQPLTVLPLNKIGSVAEWVEGCC